MSLIQLNQSTRKKIKEIENKLNLSRCAFLTLRVNFLTPLRKLAYNIQQNLSILQQSQRIVYSFNISRFLVPMLQPTSKKCKLANEGCQNYQFELLSFEILKTASEINDIPELHDRLITATARHLD